MQKMLLDIQNYDPQFIDWFVSFTDAKVLRTIQNS